MNRVVLIGRLSRDPEIRHTQAGKAVTKFPLAVSRPGRDGGADFLWVVCWDRLAEVCANNLTKGRLVAVAGRIATSQYEDKAGSKRTAWEVVADSVEFLDKRLDSGSDEEAY